MNYWSEVSFKLLFVSHVSNLPMRHNPSRPELLQGCGDSKWFCKSAGVPRVEHTIKRRHHHPLHSLKSRYFGSLSYRSCSGARVTWNVQASTCALEEVFLSLCSQHQRMQVAPEHTSYWLYLLFLPEHQHTHKKNLFYMGRNGNKTDFEINRSNRLIIQPKLQQKWFIIQHINIRIHIIWTLSFKIMFPFFKSEKSTEIYIKQCRENVVTAALSVFFYPQDDLSSTFLWFPLI